MPFSLMRYPGGKFYALKNILPEVNKFNHCEYREPFFGGGTVFFNKDRVNKNWINDKYGDLIFFLKFIKNKNNLEQLLEEINLEKTPSKERHAEVKNLDPKNDLSKAFKFYYLNRTSFSGKMKSPVWGYRPIRSVHPRNWNQKIIEAHKFLKGVKITNYDFSEIIRAEGNDVLLYLDPPYFKANQKGHYVESFNDYDHLRLQNELINTEHPFFLSYDDSEEIRSLYKDFKILDFELTYRIEDSNPNNNKRKKVNEILITNVGRKQMTFFDTKKYEFEKNRSPIRYPGSKFQAIKKIKSQVDFTKYNEYWEPFFGGGALFFSKPLSKKNILNDSNKELFNFFSVIQDEDSRTRLIQRVSKFKPTKENFEKLKFSESVNNFEAACRYFIINRTCYSGIMNKPNWGYHETKSLPPERWGDRLKIAGQKLQYAKIYCQDFRKFFKRRSSSNVFAFIDPPYFKADQKRAYEVSFELNDHEDLFNILKNSKFDFLLTYDNCPEIKEMYKDFEIIDEEWMYHTANSNVTTRKKGKELE